MKIAFLTPEFPHPKTGSSGGIGTSIFTLSQGLVVLGHEVSILIYGQSEDEVFTENGINFYRIKNKIVKGFSTYFTQKKIQKLLNKLHATKQIEILEVPDWTGFSAFINTSCPIVMRLNGSDTYFCHLDNRPVKGHNKFLEKRAFKRANGIISVSQYTGDLTNSLFNLNRDFTVIPNAIDTKKFDRVLEKKPNQTVLYFGTLIRKKGLLELPLIFNEVHKKNSKAKLILVGKDASDKISGSTSTWELMKNLFDKSALQQVQYLGSVSYYEIKNIIANATVCVFPTFAEAFPVSWLEAMAMEKAIVASNIGWATEVIDNNLNGYLVHPKNHLEFADRILNFIESTSLRAEFGRNARKKVLISFNSEIIAKKSIKFYKHYLKK
jgi:glycosyltransferase involved in cell wall biosynthesis